MQQSFPNSLADLRADSPPISTSTKEQHHGKTNRKSAVNNATGLVTGNQDSMEDNVAAKFSTYQAKYCGQREERITRSQ